MSGRTDSEKTLERRLTAVVNAAGGRALKFASATETGYPDRLVLWPGGRAEWVELKSRGKRPTRLQALRHAELRRLGFRVTVVDSAAALARWTGEALGGKEASYGV